VLGLINKWPAISMLLAPRAASREICASCGVRSPPVSAPLLAGVLPRGAQLNPRPLGEALHAEVGEQGMGGAQLGSGLDVPALPP
jgi:hypothetical protein